MSYLISILAFGLITFVLILYMYGLLWIVRKLFTGYRHLRGISNEVYQERLSKIRMKRISRWMLFNPLKAIALFVLVLNASIVSDTYARYVNDNMRNPDATALYIVGDIANVYAKALSVFVGAPDRWYAFPLHAPWLWIKQGLFAFGERYIDYNGAERALWKYDWFYHPYVVKFHQHRGFFDRKERQYSNLWGNETFRTMLEDLWKMMEIMNTQPFEDKNRYYDFLMVMPTIGTYYFLFKGELLPEDEFEKRNIYNNTNPLITKRNARLQEMMEEVYRNWNDPVFIKERLYKAPQVEATYKALMLMLMEQRISELIYARTFSCTHPMIQEYTELRQEFFSNQNGPLKLLIKQGKEKRAQEFIDDAKDNIGAEYARQLLWEYCGIDLFGVSRLYWPKEGMAGFYSGLATEKRGFPEEIRILENELNITRINESKPTVTKEDIKNSRSKK